MKVKKVEVDITNKNENGLFNPSNTVDKIDYFKRNEEIQLVAKEGIKNYKDLRGVTFSWATDTQTFEEGFVLKEIAQ